MYLENLIDLYDSEDRKLDMEALGLLGLKLQIPSPSYKTNTQEVDGRGGISVTDRFLQPRSLSAEFITMANDYEDSLRLRNTLYRILGNGRKFFIAESKIPNKRWRVHFEEWTPERQDVKVHTFNIPLISEEGFSESINKIKKTYNTTSFMFNNEGDIPIDPRVHSELEIEFTGESNVLIIRNNTTGVEWAHIGSTVSTDQLTIHGVRSFKNDLSVFKFTNKKLVSLVPGWNNIEILGTSGPFTLTVTTRFYFL